VSLRERILTASTGFDLLALDDDYIGSCPCATVEGDGSRLEMHCWRSSAWSAGWQCDHRSTCAHLWGVDQEVASHVKDVLDRMDWYGEWDVVLEDTRPPY
jgi:hypothetical protein